MSSLLDPFLEGLNGLSASEQNEFVRPFLCLGGVRKKDLKLALIDEINGHFPERDFYQHSLEKFVKKIEQNQERAWRELGYE